MQHLWAPWRNSYVRAGEKPDPHLFHTIGQNPATDLETHVIHRGPTCFALLNAFPYTAGHSLILPFREVADPADLTPDESAELWDTVLRVKNALTNAFSPHGFNIGINLGEASGAGLPRHLHVHVVPRWKDDANFMTATAETRIHPTDLPQIAARLRKALATLNTP